MITPFRLQASATPMTIAERHNLQRNDLCEIRTSVMWGPERREHVHWGKYSYTAPDGRPHFQVVDATVPFNPDVIRSVQKVTPEHVAKQFHVDQRVIVRKYGSDYNGVVKEVKRTRLSIEFTTLGGKVKTQWFPAWEVKLPV